MKILLFANTDWYLFNFRLALTRAIAGCGASVVVVSPPGPYGARLRAEGLRWIPISMDRVGINPLRELGSIRELVSLYRAEKPDLVHHFTVKSVAYGSIAARLAGVPAVVNAITGLGYVFCSRSVRARTLRPMLRSLLRAVLDGDSSRVVVQNPDDRDMFAHSGVARADIVRLIRGSGVDTSLFRPRQSPPNAVPRVLLATRLLWDKGVKEFVDAARLLRGGGVHAEFVLAGAPDPGNPASIPQEQIDRWQREGVVTALGHVSDMASLLQQVDVVVLPTRYGEGVPRILVEAAASGLPLVASDAPGCREIVRHGVNGLLTAPRDTGELADAIRRLLLQPQLRASMGTCGRNIALAEFDERIVIAQTLAVYDEVLEGTRARTPGFWPAGAPAAPHRALH